MDELFNTTSLNEKLKQLELKVTPQRIAVLEALLELTDHPSAERIIDYIKTRYPNVAIGTVYNTLETFHKKGLIKKVKTDKDVMRYDIVLHSHHHLYSNDTDRIEDYIDEDINELIKDYFRRIRIANFVIEDFRLQLVGKFTDK